MNVDDLFVETGQCGPYQVRQYLLLAFPIIFSSYQTITYIFSTGIPNYRCLVPECEDELATKFWTPWLHSAVPFRGEAPEQCMRFQPLVAANYTGAGQTDPDVCSDGMFNNHTVIRCNTFVFRQKEKTVASEFKILCQENDWKIALVGTTNYLGFFVGMPIAGVLSDSYGRKKVLISSCFIQSLIGVARSFSTGYESYLMLQFLGAFWCGAYNAGFVIALEAVGPSKRVLGNAIICCFHSLGEANVALVMWLLKDWRRMSQLLFAPGLLILFYIRLVPESVRWLITKGRPDEAIEVFKEMARVNHKELSPTFESKVQELAMANMIPVTENSELKEARFSSRGTFDLDDFDETRRSTARETSISLSQIMGSSRLIVRMFYSVICWCIITMVFFGLALRSVSVAGNKYLNFVLSVLVELPGYIATYFLMDVKQVGRRPSLYLSLFITGTSCILFHFLRHFWALQMISFLTGKLTITFSFAVIYIFTAEMFPTELRNSLLGICAMAGHVGSMIAPQTALLSRYFDAMFLWGAFALLAALISTQFPETRNTRLPDTIEEAEDLDTY